MVCGGVITLWELRIGVERSLLISPLKIGQDTKEDSGQTVLQLQALGQETTFPVGRDAVLHRDGKGQHGAAGGHVRDGKNRGCHWQASVSPYRSVVESRVQVENGPKCGKLFATKLIHAHQTTSVVNTVWGAGHGWTGES